MSMIKEQWEIGERLAQLWAKALREGEYTIEFHKAVHKEINLMCESIMKQKQLEEKGRQILINIFGDKAKNSKPRAKTIDRQHWENN